jgi:ribA/ribD-fused uncharacterized protein
VTVAPGPQAVISRLDGPWRLLSNFHRHPVAFRGTWWPSAEHAFQSAKRRDPGYWQALLGHPAPADAKRLGRRVQVDRPDWDAWRVPVMMEVLTAKFTDPGLRRGLLATGGALIVEGNSWHDQFWGDCQCGRPSCAAPGRNVLGCLLMAARAAAVQG